MALGGCDSRAPCARASIATILVPLLCSAAFAAPTRPTDVPSPRMHDGWVTDLAEVVSAEQEQRIDDQVTALHAELGAELAVVTVSEVEGEAKAFATELFNLWGIGDATANNGVLVLLVVDARRVEIETGYGVEGILNDGWLGRMMDSAMVPAFRSGELGAGLVAGVDAIDDRLRAHPDETRQGTGTVIPTEDEVPVHQGRRPRSWPCSSIPNSDADRQLDAVSTGSGNTRFEVNILPWQIIDAVQQASARPRGAGRGPGHDQGPRYSTSPRKIITRP